MYLLPSASQLSTSGDTRAKVSFEGLNGLVLAVGVRYVHSEHSKGDSWKAPCSFLRDERGSLFLPAGGSGGLRPHAAASQKDFRTMRLASANSVPARGGDPKIQALVG